LSGAKDTVLGRIEDARRDRTRATARVNRFYELALPHRQLVGQTSDTARDPGEQDDIFDSTLQDCVDDYASDMLDAFTPHYKPWVPLEASRKLNTAQQRQFEEAIKAYEEKLYGEILNSTFYQESQECWSDIAGGAAGMLIPFEKAGERIRPQPITMSSLLMDHGPKGELDGRWFEMRVQKRHLRHAFPGINFDRHENLTSAKCKNSSETVTVIQGCYRDYDFARREAWKFTIHVDSDKVHDKRLTGAGCQPIIAGRWRTSPPSAWGPGPADRALAPASTLNELNYLILKHLGKQVDPPFLYDDDGMFNPDDGINAGEAYPRRPGSTFDFLVTEQDLRVAYFQQEDLRMAVRRALYQDKPFQRGDTPPTATQWLDEKAFNDRRLQLSRMRLYDEWVIPALQRFTWILARRGELPEVRIGGEIVGVRYVNPISRASDLQEVNNNHQFISMSVSTMGEAALASIDTFRTMENMKRKMGADLVELKPPDQQSELVQQILAGAAGNGRGAKVPKPAGG